MVSPSALKMFEVAEARDPRNVSARYYLGLAAAQSGTPNVAIAAWANLLAEAPPDAPYVADLRRSITDTAKAAGLPVPPLEAERQPSGNVADAGSSAQAEIDRDQAAGTDAMVRGMVERLASELDAKPNNIQGWLQLGQAYTVLHDRTKAVTAFEHAAMLKPNDPAILVRELNALMLGKSPEAPVAPRVVSLLHRIEALDPSQPEALWYLGLTEAQAHHPSGAARYWRRLADELPASSAVRQTVLKALATVEGTQ